MRVEMVVMTLAHAEVAAALHETGMRRSAADEVWEAVSIRGLLATAGTFGLLATHTPGMQPAGFVLGRNAADEAEILTVVVAPAFRREGIGRALLEGAVGRARRAGARRMFLEVAEDNDPARALYRDSGFTAVGRRPGYYRRENGAVDALVMGRPL